MRRLLIAHPDELFLEKTEAVFSAEFETRTCADGETALKLLLEFQPDVLILQLSLPYKDGLTVLQQTAKLPPVILEITNYIIDYIETACAALGVGYIQLSPAHNSLRVRVMDMIARHESQQGPPDLLAQIALHLHILDFPTHRLSYARLCQAIYLFHLDPEQCLKPVLYPEVARCCGASSGDAVERSIRSLIAYAWEHRDPLIWANYFPNAVDEPPSNRQFFDVISKRLKG